MEQSLDAAAGVKSFLFISLNRSLQQHFSSLRGKQKELTPDLLKIKCGTKQHIFAVLKFVIPALLARESSSNTTSQDLFPINFPKFLRNVPFVTRRKDTASRRLFDSDFAYSHHCLSFELKIKVGPISLH